MHAQTYANSMCLSLCVCACVKFNNYTRIIPKWLRFFFRTTRHSHDDMTMSIVLQSQNSFSVGRNSKSKRATCKEITKRLLFILLFSDAHDATTATRDRYKISIQILCMRIFDFLLLYSRWCAVLNRSHFTLQFIVDILCVCVILHEFGRWISRSLSASLYFAHYF